MVTLIQKQLVLIASALLVVLGVSQGHTRRADNISRTETLDPEGKYVVGWTVDFLTNIVEVSLQVETNGFVGFGLSPQGGMTGADIVIGGVFSNGTSYFSDRHGIGNQEPVIDAKQNWELLEGNENGTHTFLRLSRRLDTCDDEDVAITEDTVKLIWAYGPTDDIVYHAGNRGAYSVNMLDASLPPIDLSKYESFDVMIDIEMPSADTTYWCTIQKSPLPLGKRHVIGFVPNLVGPDAVTHTHHFNMYTCSPPPGQDAYQFFERYVGQSENCYMPKENPLPRDYCNTNLYAWSVGGRIMLFPNHTGFPIAESEHEYYLFETHLDNPDERVGVQVETGVTFYHTTELREHDAGLLAVGHTTTLALTIPPETSKFTIAGHCSSACTGSLLPSEGINAFNIMLHAHISGRELKLRHFRDGTELPWLSVDTNYDFDYQENRPLREDAKILPGDHLTLECSYASTWKSPPGAVIGGESSRDEMCNTFIFYWPRAEIDSCFSAYPDSRILRRFGIDEVQAIPGGGDYIVISPPEYANMTYSEVLDTQFSWTEALVTELQADLQFSAHNDICFGRTSEELLATLIAERARLPMTKYPIIEQEYQPPNYCPTNRTMTA